MLGIVVTAILGLITASGVVKFFIEPWWMERSLSRQLATSLWLSCRELRLHFQEIDKKVRQQNDQATRDALKKIPGNDYKGNARWFVKEGYFSMITAYKIAAFSSWLRIYQSSLLRYSSKKSRKFMSDLYNLSNDFKLSISGNTILWYYYFDAIGDKVTRREDGTNSPMDFGAFCRSYSEDKEFLGFFEQLHMFIHFFGREEPEWGHYRDKLPDLIKKLQGIEINLKNKNLLKGIHVEEPRTIRSNILAEQH